MKYFLIAGEASGDLHGARLMKSLVALDPTASFHYWGGDKMQEVADGLLVHYKDVAIMGFLEVALRLRRILGNIKLCKEQITSFQPDVVIFIDYPGFNLRMAKFCKEQGIKTVYFIAPKVWAWKENRAKSLEKYIDLLLLIFPFEVEYFKKWKVNALYIGNPLTDEINDFKANQTPSWKTEKPVVALLPGSRKQEIDRMLPTMLIVAENMPSLQFVVCGAHGLSKEVYAPYLKPEHELLFGSTYEVLSYATAAIVCSGTATLETALFGIPQVCGYLTSGLSYSIAKAFVKIKYISLVNLNLDKPCIQELIQDDFIPIKLQEALKLVLPESSGRTAMLNDYQTLKSLFETGGATDKAAAAIADLMKVRF